MKNVQTPSTHRVNPPSFDSTSSNIQTNMHDVIPYGRQTLDESDRLAVMEVLATDFLTQGPWVSQFEQKLADLFGCRDVIAVNSGTAALHLACRGLDLQPGEWVWTTPITFLASANAARYCGAHVDFVDIDPITRNISITALHEKILSAEKNNLLPKILIVVHFAGQPVDMASIYALTQQFGIAIIEDGCHALGAHYEKSGRNGENFLVGKPIYADAVCFSFHPVKSITCGEGGAVCTNRGDIAQIARRLRSHGVERATDRLQAKNHETWYYEQHDLGFNYRLTDIQAALGHSQIKKLASFIQRRREIAVRYQDELKNLPLKRPQNIELKHSAFHLYVIEFLENGLRDHMYRALRQQNIQTQVHYFPVHLHPYYQNLGFKTGQFPHAENYSQRCLSLPIFPTLTYDQQSRVIQGIRDFFNNNYSVTH
ncbi:MAG: UDP-4-amino-4,6-dideoxy-N-acetyl-beta-L-altrosamine transaminase [Pseudomonadota bacterium]